MADGGSRAGFGHLGRCLALWEEVGERAAFRTDDSDAARYLRERGVEVVDETSRPLVVLDRVKPTTTGEVLSLQSRGDRVCLIDDLGEGRQVADVVVDPPTARSWPPANGRRLAGFEHVLLRREIRSAREAGPRNGYVLLGMGGSDPASLTPPLAGALAMAGIAVKVVLGPGYRGALPEGGEVIRNPAGWPSLLARATVFVTGFGHSLLEAAHLGVPAISVVSRPDHLEHASAFCANGTAHAIDMSAGPRTDVLLAELRGLLEDPAMLAAMSERGRALVDGRGASRVAAGLEGLT